MTTGIHKKPVVDEAAIEAARIAEEKRANDLIKNLDEGGDGGDGEGGDEQPPKKPEVPPAKPPIDWEAKAKASAQEALVLKAQLDKQEEEKNKKVEITDQFLKDKYPEWEDLTLGEQKAIKKSEELAQEVQELKNNANKFNNDREWNEKVDGWLTDEMPDQFPLIVGREEEFKRYATRPTRKGLSFEVLGKIFLADNPPVVTKKKDLFHAPGSAGKPAADEGMSPEDARLLRTTKPAEYMRLMRDKKIKQIKI